MPNTPPISEETILNRVLTEYPTPIANPARWMLEGVHRGDHMRHFLNGILDTYEATVHFLALVQLREYLETGASDKDYNIELLDTLEKNLSLGHWVGLVRELTRRLVSNNRPMILDGLRPLMGKKGWEKEAKPLDDLVGERNRTRGHPSKFLENRDFQDLIQRNHPLILGLLDELSFLGDLHLVGVVNWDGLGSNWVREAFVFRGKDPDTHYRPNYRKEVAVPVESGEREGLLLLHDIKRCTWLKMGPMALFFQDFRADLQDAFFLSSLSVKKRRVRSAEFRSYSLGVPALTMPQAEEGDVWLRTMTSWLNERFSLGPEQEFLVEKTQVDPRANRILAMKQVGFVGRKDLLAKVQHDLIAGTRMVHIKGPKGQGKSAFIARLIQRAKDQQIPVLYYFFSQTEGTAMVESALFHLLAQASEINLVSRPPRPDSNLEELIDSLHDLLSEGNEMTGEKHPWVVLDGLDELSDSASSLQLFWAAIEQAPPVQGAALLIAGREDSPLSLSKQLALEGLNSKDVREILFRKGISTSEEFAIELCRRVGGNPLFLIRIIDGLPDTPEIKDIPKQSLNWQKEELKRLLNEARLHNLDAIFRSVAALLTAAIEPLSPTMIKGLIGAPEGQIGHALRLISPVLGGKSRIAFFHHSFREAAGEMLDSLEIEAMHGLLADWCLNNQDDPYVAHLVHHLLRAQRFQDAVTLLSRDAMLRRIKNGTPMEDVLSDVRHFIAAVKGAPEHLPRICRVLNEATQVMAQYQSRQDLVQMAQQGDIKQMIAFADFLNPDQRRHVLLSALLSSHPGDKIAMEIEGALEADLDGIKSKKVRQAYRDVISKVLQVKTPGKKISIVKCLPQKAYEAALAGNHKKAAKSIRRFLKEGNWEDQGLTRRCLFAMALFPGSEIPKEIVGPFRSLPTLDPECSLLLQLISQQFESAKISLKQLPQPRKPGEFRDRIMMAHLAKDGKLADSLLSKLKNQNLDEYRKALCFIIPKVKPGSEEMEKLEALSLERGDRDLIGLCQELLTMGKRELAAIVAARGGSRTQDFSSDRFKQWCEEVIEQLAGVAPERAENLIPEVRDTSRRAMAWAILAANLKEDQQDRVEIYADEARKLCLLNGDNSRKWLRVLEMIAFASSGKSDDLTAFWRTAGATPYINHAVVHARLMAIRLAGKGKLKAAELVAKQFMEFLRTSAVDEGWAQYRTGEVFSWISFYAAATGNKKISDNATALVISKEKESERAARMYGRLGYASYLRGDLEDAATGFARAIHIARHICKNMGNEKDIHSISSALHWISLDEFRSGFLVEAKAHAFEAWEILHKTAKNDYALTEVLGTIAKIGFIDEALELVKKIPSSRRKDQARGFIARALIARVREVEQEEAWIFNDLNHTQKLLNTIRSPSGRSKQIIQLLEILIPRQSNYLVEDPLPKARNALLGFLFGHTATGKPAILPDYLTSGKIAQLAVRIWIRTLKGPENTEILEEIFRMTLREG